MLSILILFLFDRAIADANLPVVVVGSCAQIIDAEARLRARPARDKEERGSASLVRLRPRNTLGLRPFMAPQTRTADQFLKDVILRGRMPGLREYLRAVTELPPTEGWLEIRVQPAELNALLTRGTLLYPRGRIVRDVDPARIIKPSENQISLVFRRRARYLHQFTHLFPAWDLRAIVAGVNAREDVRRLLELRFDTPPEGLLQATAWSPTGGGPHLDIPLVFDLPLRPFEIFARRDVPTEAEATGTDFNRALDDSESFVDPYGFWLPYVRSVFDVTTTHGLRFRGRLLEPLVASDELVFVSDGEHAIVHVDDIEDITLAQFVPNRPEPRQIVIDHAVDLPEDIVRAYIPDPERPPMQPLIITSHGLTL